MKLSWMCLGGWKAGSTLGRFPAPRPNLRVVVFALKRSLNGFSCTPSMIFTYIQHSNSHFYQKISPEKDFKEGMQPTKTIKGQPQIFSVLVSIYGLMIKLGLFVHSLKKCVNIMIYESALEILFLNYLGEILRF